MNVTWNLFFKYIVILHLLAPILFIIYDYKKAIQKYNLFEINWQMKKIFNVYKKLFKIKDFF